MAQQKVISEVNVEKKEIYANGSHTFTVLFRNKGWVKVSLFIQKFNRERFLGALLVFSPSVIVIIF